MVNFQSVAMSMVHFRVYKWIWSLCVCVCVCPSSLRRWPLFLLVGFTDPYNHTYSESLWWKLFKNHKRTQIQRQWQRQRQRQRHRQSAWKTQHMLYFWNPDDLLNPNMMIIPHPGHRVQASHPGYPVPVIRLVLQGRVYHRFGIFYIIPSNSRLAVRLVLLSTEDVAKIWIHDERFSQTVTKSPTSMVPKFGRKVQGERLATSLNKK